MRIIKFLVLLYIVNLCRLINTQTTLNAIWFDWQPCRNFQTLGSAIMPDNTILNVTCANFPDWYPDTFADFEGEQKYDLVILDSQWIGQGVEGNHLEDLTDLINAKEVLKGDFYKNALDTYSEYPAGSGKYWGTPFQADVPMIIYRKDLLAKYNKRLPVDLDELLELSEFFQSDAASETVSGYLAPYCDPSINTGCYDETATTSNPFIWMEGGELYNASTYQIDGVVNSKETLKGLEYAKKLYATGGTQSSFFGDIIGRFCNGEAPFLQIWMGFAPSFVGSTADCNGMNDTEHLGFYSIPFNSNTNLHRLQVGGMGLHVSAYSKHKELAKEVVKKLVSYDFMVDWAKAGGFTTRKSVTGNPQFLLDNEGKFVPHQPVFLQSFPLTQDFYALPIYSDLLKVQMKYTHQYFSGELTGEKALDLWAKDQQKIMDEKYPCGKECIPQFEYSAGIVTAFGILAILSTVFAIVTIAIVVINRKVFVFSKANVKDSCFFLCGVIISYCYFYPFWGSVNGTTCALRMVFEHLGFMVCFGGIVSKTRLISRIFNSKKIKVQKPNHYTVIWFITAAVILIVARIIVEAPTTTTERILIDGERYDYTSCKGVWVDYAIKGVEFIILLWSVELAFAIKDIPSDFNESKLIVFSVYNWTLFGILFYMLAEFVVNSVPDAVLLLHSLRVFLPVTVSMIVMFVPKIHLWAKGEGNLRTHLVTDSKKGSKFTRASKRESSQEVAPSSRPSTQEGSKGSLIV